jgi:hypothetical protein
MALEIDRLAAEGGRTTFVLHPFLMLDERWFDCVRGLLDHARERALPVVPAARAAAALT